MDFQDGFILKNIINDMDEGVMILGMNGHIQFVNPATERILHKNAEELYKQTFATAFFEDAENDDFNQGVIEAVYSENKRYDGLVTFHTDDGIRQFHMVTSLLKNGDENLGAIIVFGDITDLVELKIKYATEMEDLLNSVVQTLITAVEEKSRYNASHTRRMVQIAEDFLDWMDANYIPQKMDPDKRREFIMSIWLHDVGKLAVPLSVMDKGTRLEGSITSIDDRLTKIKLIQKIDMLEGILTEEEYKNRLGYLDRLRDFVHRVNDNGIRSEEDEELIKYIEGQTYKNEDGEIVKLFSDKEIECLGIRRGTLTDKEREVMQSHVVITRKMLEQIKFPDNYKNVTEWASKHHEFINGKGYPNQLKGDEICWEVRLLTIIDIFESLTASDRPYKASMDNEKALDILGRMADEGALDKEILWLFIKSRVWENV